MTRYSATGDRPATDRPKGRTVLVTGGAGYIGSHACKALAKAGYTPLAYDSLVYGHSEAVRWGPLVVGDLADRDLLGDSIRRFDVTAVMHFAAFAFVGESMTRPEIYFRNNLANTLVLLEAALDAGVKHIVFSSTCATYGLPETVPMDENTPQRPVNPYGEAKLMVERVLHWYGQAHGMTYAALRYFNAAGADPDCETGENHTPETHLIPLVLDAALGRRAQIDIFGTDYPTPDGTAIRDYIHVQDLADAHVLALEHLRSGGASLALNLGTGSGYSVREVINAAERITGRRVPRHETKRRPGDPPALVANAGLARKVLGWTPRISDLDTILRTAWAWHCRDLAEAPRAAAAI
ncbi:MAG TPA: UDP-glucose 4-epimerase GalE [Candidatus Cybelea sp.]|nr:UDP-glucose 4-epimerase GalE [Candidatus Cybelea sp.]